MEHGDEAHQRWSLPRSMHQGDRPVAMIDCSDPTRDYPGPCYDGSIAPADGLCILVVAERVASYAAEQAPHNSTLKHLLAVGPDFVSP